MTRVCGGEKEGSDCCITEKVFLLLEQQTNAESFKFFCTAREDEAADGLMMCMRIT